jgi:hypothetical protein
MKKQILEIIKSVDEIYDNPKCELNFSSNYELLVAVILSAQCTDKRGNIVTAELFKEYSTAFEMIELCFARRACGEEVICSAWNTNLRESFHTRLELRVGECTAFSRFVVDEIHIFQSLVIDYLVVVRQIETFEKVVFVNGVNPWKFRIVERN